MLIEGLANLKDERAQAMSLDWAARWTRSNFIGYQDSQVMYEKVSKKHQLRRDRKKTFLFFLFSILHQMNVRIV